MTRIFLHFIICLTGVLGVGSVSAQVGPVSNEDALVAETKDFQVYCFTDRRCPASDVTEKQKRSVQQGLEELQEAREWLEEMGFDVMNADMDDGTDGKKAMRLQFDRATHERNCHDMAGACRILSASKQGRVILPIENAEGLVDGESLVHEYVHTIQPSRDEGKAHWLNEMVATAIGSAWVRKQTGNKKIYQPKYSLTLDREFWDGEDDPGFGKWDYAIALGEDIGSRDGVAYLAQDRFINATMNPESISGNNMALFYDKTLVKGATFDTLFPKYVARFNNVERDIGQKDRSGKYFYYGDIAEHSVTLPAIDAPFQTKFDGEVVPFAAHPILLSLKFPPPVGSAPVNNIFLAEVRVTDVVDKSGLTLVREHRLAVEKHRDLIMIDGNDAPDELGFYRVVNTPHQDSTANVAFSLEVRTRPITFSPPACFQAGKPSEMIAYGLEDAPADNWRLKVNNGSAEGLVVTPTSAGKITVDVEIDSPITRNDTGITPVAATKTRINLGTFDVASDDCELPLTGSLTASFNGKVDGMMPHLGGGLTEHGNAHWQVLLDIKTKAPTPDTGPFSNDDQIVYSDDGSSFQVNGSFKYELCQTDNRTICVRWTEEIYRGAGPITGDGGALNIFKKDGKVWLEAKLPVLTTWTEHQNGMADRTETFVRHWEIGCRSTGQWWDTQLMRGYAGHVLAMDTPLAGTWTSGNRDEIEFKCAGRWDGPVETTGKYSASIALHGRVKAMTQND